jgi:hypothetical protein
VCRYAPVWKWMVIWQCSPGIEGTSDMHLRAAFSGGALHVESS